MINPSNLARNASFSLIPLVVGCSSGASNVNPELSIAETKAEAIAQKLSYSKAIHSMIAFLC